MKIAIISAVYPPEAIVSARTSASLADYLVDKGHEVYVITAFPSRPRGKLFAGYRRSLISKTRAENHVLIIRCFSFFSSTSSLFNRLLENISFGIISGLALLFMPHIDVIYSNSWPIFATGIIRLVAGLRKIPLVIYVQDLYPESLASQGRVRESHPVYRTLLAIDSWIANGCRAVIVISEYFANVYRQSRKVPLEKITMIPNWIDSKTIQPLPKSLFALEKNLPQDAFILVYGGTIGVAAGVEEFMDALRNVKATREIIFLVAGDGSQLAACKKMAAEIKSVRILFHSPWLLEENSKVLAYADVLVLPTHGDQSFASVPSKLISYLLAGKPVLAVSYPETDMACMISQVGCGWIVAPGSSAAIPTKINELAILSQETLDLKGKSGREYALNHLVGEICLPRITEIIMKARN